MYIARVNDPQWLLGQAQRMQQPIYLVTAHAYLPDSKGQRRPGLLMTYSVTDHENGMTWSYQEIAFPTRGGQLDLRDTLYEYIRINQPAGVAVETAPRSGAM
jgi:hypothetical protein